MEQLAAASAVLLNHLACLEKGDRVGSIKGLLASLPDWEASRKVLLPWETSCSYTYEMLLSAAMKVLAGTDSVVGLERNEEESWAKFLYLLQGDNPYQYLPPGVRTAFTGLSPFVGKSLFFGSDLVIANTLADPCQIVRSSIVDDRMRYLFRLAEKDGQALRWVIDTRPSLGLNEVATKVGYLLVLPPLE